MRNPLTMNFDKMSTAEMVAVMTAENANAVRAVEEASESIAQAIDMVADAFSNGNRLFFIGAGTSGRLGVLDASECPPTFGVSPDMVQGIIAGGKECMFRAAENEPTQPGEEFIPLSRLDDTPMASPDRKIIRQFLP